MPRNVQKTFSAMHGDTQYNAHVCAGDRGNIYVELEILKAYQGKMYPKKGLFSSDLEYAQILRAKATEWMLFGMKQEAKSPEEQGGLQYPKPPHLPQQQTTFVTQRPATQQAQPGYMEDDIPF